MILGLVIGKFLPPHRGHGLVIEAALARCDEVMVVVCDAAWHDVDSELRRTWLVEWFPSIRALVLDQDELGLDDDDSEGWARATTAALGRSPDVVFTSEDYGPRYAATMGAEHVMVDRERRAVPIGARAIRARPQAHLDWLPPSVRAHYVARVCIVGAESTGKTTLAAGLARHYGVRFVPEFGRTYTEAMPDPPRYHWHTDDFRLIAAAQAAIEDDTARWTPPPLVCDTNPFVTALFHELYLGRANRELETTARARRYDLFVVCDPDTPFAQDGTGLRRDGAPRRSMHRRLCEYVQEHRADVLHVAGSQHDRLEAAVTAVDRLLAGHATPARG